MRNPIAFSILAAASMLPTLSLAAACNGFDELCDKRYSNVTWVGSHNSAFVGVLPVHNQFVSPTKQLDMGVRFLQAQTHEKDGGIEMCHTDCILLDAGSLEKYLREVAGWVKSSGHEREVVTLLLTNQDGIDVGKYAEIFKKVGLEDLAFTPGQGTGEGGILTMEEWPTLGEMLASGKRIVVFMDYHANTASVPYISDQFAYFFEGPYDTTDKNFPQCAIDRPSGASPDGRMYLVNHYLDIDLLGVLIPHVAEAPNTNSLNSILAQADLCMDTYNRGPNVMLLDWINVGDAMGAQEVLNNL